MKIRFSSDWSCRPTSGDYAAKASQHQPPIVPIASFTYAALRWASYTPSFIVTLRLEHLSEINNHQVTIHVKSIKFIQEYPICLEPFRSLICRQIRRKPVTIQADGLFGVCSTTAPLYKV